MNSIILLFGTGIIVYIIEIVLVGGFLAFLIQKKGKPYSWKVVIPILMLFFMLNETFYLPAFISANVTFTVNNQELANFLELEPNESLTNFLVEDFLSVTSWFIEAVLSFGFASYLTKKRS